MYLQFLYISAIEVPQFNAKFIIRKRLWPLTEVKSKAACIYTPSSSVNLSSYFISPKMCQRQIIYKYFDNYSKIYLVYPYKGINISYMLWRNRNLLTQVQCP